ncbi:MAG: mechanosensitive ion channel [Gemmatimonadetes bacterium]|nr:mechanosensitive ion channel [Gemmatimonadota bacterium]
MESLIPVIAEYGLKVIGAIAILVAGRVLSGLLANGADRAMTKNEVDPTLRSFLTKLVRFAVITFAVIAAIGAFGIQTTSFAAVLGAAGFAIGMALQGSLGNFASGVLLLVFRPFRMGDAVVVAGQSGKVAEIGIFTTTMNTFDNRRIIIPNGLITGAVIENITANDTRRVDMTAGIGYASDYDRAKVILEKILADHPKVLDEPAPKVALMELADSSVNFNVRPWCNTADYWDVWTDVQTSIKREFDKAGIEIPFPQRDVHLYSETAN